MSDHPCVPWSWVVFQDTSLRIKLLKLLDRFIGPVLCRIAVLLLRPAPARSPAPQRFLVIRPGGIGDAVLTIPLVRELSRSFPGSRIDILAQRRNRAVFALADEGGGAVFSADGFAFFRVLAQLRRRRYDAIFDTEQWHIFSALTAVLVGSGERVGFDSRPLRSRLYHRRVPFRLEEFEAQKFLSLLDAYAPQENPRAIEVPFIRLRAAAQKQRSAQGFCVVISVSAHARLRLWPFERWEELCRFLIAKGRTVILVGSVAQRPLARRLLEAVRGAGAFSSFVGETTLAETAALIAAADYYIGMDSGVLHLAYALGKPAVGLFGPGIAAQWGPPGEFYRQVASSVACRPCGRLSYTPPCRRPRCMEAITAEAVVRAAQELEEVIRQKGQGR